MYYFLEIGIINLIISHKFITLISKEDNVLFEFFPFQILKYLIISWKCETAGVTTGALLEGQLVISIEALNSKHQANTLHCLTTSK